jgi:hypothetical protein
LCLQNTQKLHDPTDTLTHHPEEVILTRREATMPHTPTTPLTDEQKANGRAMLIGIAVAAVGTWTVGSFLLGPFLIPWFVAKIPWWMHTIVFVILFATVTGMLIRTNETKKAKAVYDGSLNDLKRDPNNPDLRQRTLLLGRQYAELLRNGDSRTVYDEVALMNDINAACARATTPATPADIQQPRPNA